MMALNASTGKVDPGFGKEGSVPLEVAYEGTPIIYKNMLAHRHQFLRTR